MPTPPRPSTPRCSICSAPAMFRYAIAGRAETPDAALWRDAVLRCPAHFPIAFPSWVAAVGGTLVIDGEFTAEHLGSTCSCGLPGDHRYPASGEGRPCLPIDATVRFLPVSLPAVPGQLTLDQATGEWRR